MKDNRDNNIYDALDSIDLNDLNGIYTEEAESDTGLIKSKVMEKIKLKNSKTKVNSSKEGFYRWRKAIVAAAILIVVTGSFINGEMAKANRIHENTSIEAYGMDVDNQALEKYSTNVNKVATDKDVNLKVKNVLIDKNTIWIDYEVYSDKYNFKEGVWPKEMDNVSQLGAKLNGKEISTGVGRRGNGGIANKNTFTYTQAIDLTDFDIKGKINVEVYTSHIGNENGSWKLNFQVDSKDIVKETKEYKVGGFLMINKSLVRIKSVVISPIQTTLYYNAFGKNNVISLLNLLNEDKEPLNMISAEESSKFFIKSGKIHFSSAKIKGEDLKIFIQKMKKLETGETVVDGKPKEIKVNISK